MFLLSFQNYKKKENWKIKPFCLKISFWKKDTIHSSMIEDQNHRKYHALSSMQEMELIFPFWRCRVYSNLKDVIEEKDMNANC